MMSQPPTSLPSTKSCGIVGQLEIADSSWRIRGSGRMSSAAYCTPSAFRAAEERIEKPHAGWSGVPFMKSITEFSSIACWRKARISSFVMSVAPWGRRLERERVDRAPDLFAEDRVHELVLLNAREPAEAVGDDLRTEMVSAPCQVLDGRGRSRKGLLDARSELLGAGHCYTEDSDPSGS